MAAVFSADAKDGPRKWLRSMILCGAIILLPFWAQPAAGQVKQTRAQVMFYTSGWTGPRFPDGRPKLPDDLLVRAKSMTIEDIWDFLREHGYQNQFEGGWQVLHSDKPFAGRVLTAQYMPYRPDMASAIDKEGKSEGRVGDTNSWPIAELQSGDVYVADGFGKIVRGTLIGSNLGNAIAARDHTGFVFDAGIRDQEELRGIPDFNGLYRGYDPSDWAQMELTSINAPIRMGRAVVLPGDLVLVKPGEGVIFIPAILAEAAVSSAEFTSLKDAYNFQLNREGKNGERFEGGWNAQKYAVFAKWIDAHPAMLKMPRSEFDALIVAAETSAVGQHDRMVRRNRSESRRYTMHKKAFRTILTTAFVLVAVSVPLLHAEGRKIDPTFLYRNTAAVQAKPSDITTATCQYKPLFGQGDGNTSVVVGVARYGEAIVASHGACASVTYSGEDQVYVVLQGNGSVQYGNESVSLKPEDYIYLPATISHALRNVSAEPMTVVVMGFRTKGFKKAPLPPRTLKANIQDVPTELVGGHPDSTKYRLLMGDLHSKRDRIAVGRVLTSLFLMEIAPGGTNFPHHHEREEEIYLVLSGHGTMVAGGGMDGIAGRHPAKAGDAYFFRLNATVGYYSAPDTESRLLCVRSWYPGMVLPGMQH